ncbi:MAG: HEAT repeat domain-containing protein [Gemmatimonadaceae bacterium]
MTLVLILSLPFVLGARPITGTRALRPERSVQTPVRFPTADSALARQFLAAVRGASPVLCELALRSLDNRFGGWWTQTSIGPASDDASARALLEWSGGRDARSDASAVPLLRAALSDADLCTRYTAAHLLGAMRDDERALAALLAELGSGNPRTREMAALGLGEAGATAATDEILELLDDSDARVRRTTTWALGEIEDPTALPHLLTSLRDDSDAGVRTMAAWAIANMH